MNFGLVPLLPNPRVVEERDTKSITALLTVKHLNESGDETEDLIGGSSRSTAVKSLLSAGYTADDIRLARVLYPLPLKLLPLRLL